MGVLVFIRGCCVCASTQQQLPHIKCGERLEGRWDMALRDLDYALVLDTDGDGAITWGELRASHLRIADYTLARLELSTAAGRCALKPASQQGIKHTDGAYRCWHSAHIARVAERPACVTRCSLISIRSIAAC